MNIVNLTRLINGELLTNPSISFVTGFTFNAKDVKTSFAFIAVNASNEDIREAVDNGAYAIIYDSEFDIENSEIAYIKVLNLNHALSRLMRFQTSLYKHKFILLNKIQKDIFSFISFPKKMIMMPTCIHELFVSVMNAKESSVFLGEDIEMIDKISSGYEKINPDKEAKLIYKGSIFYSNFICEGVYYQNLNFPRVFVDELCGIIKFMNLQKAAFKLHDFRNLTHFESVFVDKFFKICPFGTSHRAFIIEKDKELFIKAKNFLNEEFSSGIVTVSKKECEIPTDIKFKSYEELKNLPDFHYALVFGDKKSLIEMLNIKKEEQTLF